MTKGPLVPPLVWRLVEKIQNEVFDLEQEENEKDVRHIGPLEEWNFTRNGTRVKNFVGSVVDHDISLDSYGVFR